jgi:hypothetical protein
MVEEIYAINDVFDLYDLSEFLVKLNDGLTPVLDEFVQQKGTDVQVPTFRQLIARRRLNWLKAPLLEKLDHMTKYYDSIPYFFAQCKMNIESLDWPSWPSLIDILEQNEYLVDEAGINVRQKFRAEATDEICYGVNTTLKFPCNEDTWCGVATSLIEDLCLTIAKEKWNYSREKQSTGLGEILVQKAVYASKSILFPTSFEALQLSHNCWKRFHVHNRVSIKDEPPGTSCILTFDERHPNDLIPTAVVATPSTSLHCLHKTWYLSWQVIYVVDAFASKYLADDKSYSLENLCRKVGVPLKLVKEHVDIPIQLERKSHNLFYGGDFNIYLKGNVLMKPGRRSAPKSVGGGSSILRTRTNSARPKLNKAIFNEVVWKGLEALGWTLDRGNRPNDLYFCPPGVQRKGCGFKPRVDFFDSTSLVLECLEKDPRYCNQPQIVKIVNEYKKIDPALITLKAMGRKGPKFVQTEDMIAYLKKAAECETLPPEAAGESETSGRGVGGDASRVSVGSDELDGDGFETSRHLLIDNENSTDFRRADGTDFLHDDEQMPSCDENENKCKIS